MTPEELKQVLDFAHKQSRLMAGIEEKTMNKH
jgi:hypothetical protein